MSKNIRVKSWSKGGTIASIQHYPNWLELVVMYPRQSHGNRSLGFKVPKEERCNALRVVVDAADEVYWTFNTAKQLDLSKFKVGDAVDVNCHSVPKPDRTYLAVTGVRPSNRPS